MSIVIYSATPLWSDFVKYEASLAIYLARNGIRVTWVYCDQILPVCDHTLAYKEIENQPPCETCRQCTRITASISDVLSTHPNIRVKRLSEYITADDYGRAAGDVSSASSLVELINLYEQIGFSPQPLTTSYVLSLDYIENHWSFYWNELVKIAIAVKLLSIAFNKLFSTSSYSLLFITHAHRSLPSAVCAAADQYSVPWLSYVKVNNDNQIRFLSRDDYPIIPQNRERKSLTSLIDGSGHYDAFPEIRRCIHLFPSLYQYLKSTRQELIESSRNTRIYSSEFLMTHFAFYYAEKYDAIISIFPSTSYENDILPYETHPTLTSVLNKRLGDLAKTYENILFIIRDHPMAYCGDSHLTDRSILYLFGQTAEKCSGCHNILHFGANIPISTYAIIDASSLIIAPESTVAVEAYVMFKHAVVSSQSEFQEYSGACIQTAKKSELEIYESLIDILDRELGCQNSMVKVYGSGETGRSASYYYYKRLYFMDPCKRGGQYQDVYNYYHWASEQTNTSFLEYLLRTRDDNVGHDYVTEMPDMDLLEGLYSEAITYRMVSQTMDTIDLREVRSAQFTGDSLDEMYLSTQAIVPTWYENFRRYLSIRHPSCKLLCNFFTTRPDGIITGVSQIPNTGSLEYIATFLKVCELESFVNYIDMMSFGTIGRGDIREENVFIITEPLIGFRKGSSPCIGGIKELVCFDS
jgi:hypothetical protein